MKYTSKNHQIMERPPIWEASDFKNSQAYCEIVIGLDDGITAKGWIPLSDLVQCDEPLYQQITAKHFKQAR
ncbi:hypothetical protein [Pseudanabaena minima]|uniref:hypothetical protein n=1 Tax=Pseudanabaena minima TaxID=890415 RepID=UPI003DA8224B